MTIERRSSATELTHPMANKNALLGGAQKRYSNELQPPCSPQPFRIIPRHVTSQRLFTSPRRCPAGERSDLACAIPMRRLSLRGDGFLGRANKDYVFEYLHLASQFNGGCVRNARRHGRPV
jgi:hypothetical protein